MEMFDTNFTYFNWTVEPTWNLSIEDLNISTPFFYDDLPFFTVPKSIQAIMFVMYIAITIAAVGGNGIVCYIVLAYQRMRSVTNFFIVNLAVGDIMMAVLCIPFTFVANLVLMYWPFGSIMCPLVTYAQAVSVFISAYTLVAISIDRYIAIIYPLKPRMSKLQAKLIILVIWVVAVITPLPTAVLSQLMPVIPNTTEYYICNEIWESNEQRYYYSMALMVLQYFFPLFVLIFTYTRIAVVVWGKRAPGEAENARDQRQAASKRKMVRMMITVVIIFTLCWLPMNTLIVVGDQDMSIWRYENITYVWFVCHWLAMSHGCYNPAIYCWMNMRFREGFYDVFHRICLQKKAHFVQNGSLRRCNTLTSTYTSVRTLSSRSARNCSRSGSRVLNEMQVFRNNHHYHRCIPHGIEDEFSSESHI